MTVMSNGFFFLQLFPPFDSLTGCLIFARRCSERARDVVNWRSLHRGMDDAHERIECFLVFLRAVAGRVGPEGSAQFVDVTSRLNGGGASAFVVASADTASPWQSQGEHSDDGYSPLVNELYVLDRLLEVCSPQTSGVLELHPHVVDAALGGHRSVSGGVCPAVVAVTCRPLADLYVREVRHGIQTMARTVRDKAVEASRGLMGYASPSRLRRHALTGWDGFVIRLADTTVRLCEQLSVVSVCSGPVSTLARVGPTNVDLANTFLQRVITNQHHNVPLTGKADGSAPIRQPHFDVGSQPKGDVAPAVTGVRQRGPTNVTSTSASHFTTFKVERAAGVATTQQLNDVGAAPMHPGAAGSRQLPNPPHHAVMLSPRRHVTPQPEEGRRPLADHGVDDMPLGTTRPGQPAAWPGVDPRKNGSPAWLPRQRGSDVPAAARAHAAPPPPLPAHRVGLATPLALTPQSVRGSYDSGDAALSSATTRSGPPHGALVSPRDSRHYADYGLELATPRRHDDPTTTVHRAPTIAPPAAVSTPNSPASLVSTLPSPSPRPTAASPVVSARHRERVRVDPVARM